MTYEYLCTGCGHEWEADQSIKDPPLTACPSCKKKTAKRQVSGGTGFVLKGGGWYADLYSSSGSKAKAGESKGSESKAASDSSSSSDSSSTSTESKPETKSESKTDTGAKKASTKPTTSDAS